MHYVQPAMTKRFAALGVLLLGVAALPSGASAAKVKGTVAGFELLLNPVWDEAKDPGRHGYSFREPVPTVPARFRKLFPFIPKEICLAAIAAGAQKPKGAVKIRDGGGRTVPVTIVVAPGTTLQFQNTDPFKHRLFGVNIATFQKGDTARGASRDWTVPAAGVFEIRDELAPSLRMWVVGEPNVAAIVYPSLKGQFALEVPEAGDYTVQAYFAGKKVGEGVPVSVKADLEIREPLRVAGKKEAPKDAKKDDEKKADEGKEEKKQ